VKNIKIGELELWDKCLFQLSDWQPHNLHHVRIDYIGTKYIVMYNFEREEEYCVSIEPYECLENKRYPMFYVSEEL